MQTLIFLAVIYHATIVIAVLLEMIAAGIDLAEEVI